MSAVTVAHILYGLGVVLIAIGVGGVFAWWWACIVGGVGLIPYALLIHDVDHTPDEVVR